jgi:hypothetical protein
MNRKPLAALSVVGVIALVLSTGSAIAQDPAPTPSLPASPIAPEVLSPQSPQQPEAPLGTQLGTMMSYQGQLQKSGGPYNGNCNFQFSLWDAATGGAQKGSTIAKNAVAVANGLFSVELDFGGEFVGEARWLQTAVQCAGDAGFTPLSPRHPQNGVPYALGLRPGGYVFGTDPSAIFTVQNNAGGAGLAGYSRGNASNSWGVHGQSENSIGVHGYSVNGGVGVYGNSPKGTGVFGNALNGIGVIGASGSNIGVKGESYEHDGVQGISHAAGRSGVYGENDNPNGFAGYFTGRVRSHVLEIAGGSDLAERFSQADGSVAEPGTVMVIDPDHPGQIKPSAGAYDRKVAGIVSGAGDIRPGLTLYQEDVAEGDTVMAIAGRVYVKAEALSGPIEPGDLLTTSDLPGYAMKASDDARSHGAVIGKAMTGLKEGTGLVLVIVNLQ